MNDKIIHFIASIMLAVILSFLMHYVLATIVTILIGVLKELYDKFVKKTFFDYSDLCADCFGAIIGMGVAAFTI